MVENNRVSIIGLVTSEFEFNHEVFGEGFYMLKVQVERISDSFDTIPLMISDRLINVNQNVCGKYLRVAGEYRSYNQRESGRNKLNLSVFVQEVQMLEDENERNSFNEVFLDGYLCKQPTFRITPLGRKISDLLLAVNRSYGKTDYIPCICWGRNACYAENFQVGEHLRIVGRIQSREYQKKVNETEVKYFTAYEISVSKLECIQEDEYGDII